MLNTRLRRRGRFRTMGTLSDVGMDGRHVQRFHVFKRTLLRRRLTCIKRGQLFGVPPSLDRARASAARACMTGRADPPKDA